MRRMRVWVAAGFVALTLLAAACGDDPAATPGAGGDGATPSPSEDAGAKGGYGAGGGTTGGTGSDGGGAAVSVSLVNFQFSPARITVRSGESIEVTDTNPQTPHTFTVRRSDIDVALDPQTSQTIEIGLDPGTYDVICRFHEAQGMTATLVVT